MRHAFKYILIASAAGLVVLTTAIPSFAERDKQRKTAVSSTEMPVLSYEDSVKYNTLFLDAILAEAADKTDSAYALLKQCIELNPNAAEAYYFLAPFESDKKNDSLAIAYLTKAVELSPDNEDYQERLAEYYINARQYSKAIDVYEALVARHGDRTDVLQLLLQLYNQQKDYDNMLRVLARLEQNDGNSEGLTLSKVHVFELKGDKKSACKALQDLCQSYPNDLGYQVMLGNWFMQNNEPKAAFERYQNVLNEEPENAMALASMYDYYTANGDTLKAKDIMKRSLLSKNTDSEAKQSMLKQLIQTNEKAGGDSTIVLNMFDKVLEISPKDAAVAELKVAYMSLKKMPTAAIDSAIIDLLNVTPDRKGARIQLLQDMWSAKNWAQIVEQCHTGLAFNPDELAFYYFMSLAYIQLEKPDLVVETIRKGMAHCDKANKDMVAELYAIMGDYLQKQHQTKESYAAYDSCLAYKSDNIYALNNYAYYLCENGGNLQKAAQMSYKTVEAEPRNASYLDTYSWILFMQGHYTEARIYADQALQNDTDSVASSVILEHAGDIYAQLKDMKKAVDYWQRALKAGSGNEAILMKKIRLKKYIKSR